MWMHTPSSWCLILSYIGRHSRWKCVSCHLKRHNYTVLHFAAFLSFLTYSVFTANTQWSLFVGWWIAGVQARVLVCVMYHQRVWVTLVLDVNEWGVNFDSMRCRRSHNAKKTKLKIKQKCVYSFIRLYLFMAFVGRKITFCHVTQKFDRLIVRASKCHIENRTKFCTHSHVCNVMRMVGAIIMHVCLLKKIWGLAEIVL